jgi:hypothetical protein
MGAKQGVGFEIRMDGRDRAVCDLGVIGGSEYSGAPLILVEAVTVCGLEQWEWLHDGRGDLQMTRDGDRSFLHVHADDGRWTYELHPAYWWDGRTDIPWEFGVYLGVWPD